VKSHIFKKYVFSWVLAFHLFCMPFSFLFAEELGELEFSKSDRILILAPHPDDEVLGCGGIIQKSLSLNLPVRIVFFTYGDFNQWSFLVYRKHLVLGSQAIEQMGLVRDEEAHKAADKLGIRPDQLIFLGYPDFGTQSIWFNHWGDELPAVGPLSRARRVPYADAFRPGALYKGEEIVKDLQSILRDFKPTKIFLSHPADFHPDHRCLYLFTLIALWNIEGEFEFPQLFPYLVHFRGWPSPKGLQKTLKLTPPPALQGQIRWVSEDLDDNQVNKKLAALMQHKSQYESGAFFLKPFIRKNELFGDFPEVAVGHGSAPPLELENREGFLDFPEQLIEEEKARFVGVEARYIELREDRLIISFRLSGQLAKEVELSIQAFGYRKDVPFELMPKLRIKVGVLNYELFEKKRKLPKQTIQVKKEKNRITVSLPLDAMGNPQKVLMSAHTYLGEIPLDFISWRIVTLPLKSSLANRNH
jgi:LmbE family N-acetylglucosaminyl deacetylase